MLSGIRALAITRVAELGRAGMGADRIYSTIRDEYGPGYSRSAVREDVFPFRSSPYLQRYSSLYRARPERTPASMWLERGLATTQRAEYLWEVEYDLVTTTGAEKRYASFTSDSLRTDQDVLAEAVEKATDNSYGEITGVRIVSRFHANL